jgi:Regulator of ribonuclease activity B
VLRELRKRGSNLSKATDIVFFLYIPSLRDARSSVQELDRDGLSAQYEQPLGRLSDGSFEKRYSVVAHARATPTIEHLRSYRSIFKNLARRFGGDYDGWEAAVAQ